MEDAKTKVTCGCYIFILAFNLLVGGLTFDYCLQYIFNKDAPWYIDILCGLFLGEITIPLTLVLWLLDLVNIISPPLVS